MINDKEHEVEYICTRLDDLRRTYSNLYRDVHGFAARKEIREWNSEEWLQEQIDYFEFFAQSDVRFEEQMALWTAAAGGDRAAALLGIPVANLRDNLRRAFMPMDLTGPRARVRDPLARDDDAAFDVILSYLNR